MSPRRTFTDTEFETAHATWGANCGPAALAFALQTTLDAVRQALPDFAPRGYTNPTMMREALAFFARGFGVVRKPTVEQMFNERMALVRIQWTGPWTKPKPQRWASKHTHWIAAWSERGVPLIFDCNGGIQGLNEWAVGPCERIVRGIKECDGWEPANVWRLR